MMIPPPVQRQCGQSFDQSPISRRRPSSPYPAGAIITGFDDSSSDEDEVAPTQAYVAAVSDSGLRLSIKEVVPPASEPAEMAHSPPPFPSLDNDEAGPVPEETTEPVVANPKLPALADIDTGSLTKAQKAALKRLAHTHEVVSSYADADLSDQLGLKLLHDHRAALARVNCHMQDEHRRAAAHVRCLNRSAIRRRIVSSVIRKYHRPPEHVTKRFCVADSVPVARP